MIEWWFLPGLLMIAAGGLELLCRAGVIGLPVSMDRRGLRTGGGTGGHSQGSGQVSGQIPARITIVAAGDSLTFGYRVDSEFAYPTMLQRSAGGKILRVINSGISGHTSRQLLDRYHKDVMDFQPDVVLLWIGTNDGMLKTAADGVPGTRPWDLPPRWARSALVTTVDALPWVMKWKARWARRCTDPKRLQPRVTIEQFRSNMEQLLVKSGQLKTSRIVVFGLPRVPDSFSPDSSLVDLQRESHRRYDEVLASVAGQKGIRFIPLWDQLKAGHFLADGLHLSASGNEVIARLARQSHDAREFEDGKAFVAHADRLMHQDKRPRQIKSGTTG